MESTRYTGKDLAQMARNTAKQYKLRFVSWEIVVTQNKEHFETYVSLQVAGVDADGHSNTINTAL